MLLLFQHCKVIDFDFSLQGFKAVMKLVLLILNHVSQNTSGFSFDFKVKFKAFFRVFFYLFLFAKRFFLSFILPDGFCSEHGVTFETAIIDKFGVAFGCEGETLSVGCSVIVYPSIKKYKPEVVWYRDCKYEN